MMNLTIKVQDSMWQFNIQPQGKTGGLIAFQLRKST